MNKIKYVLWDLDGTLSDFDKAEETALKLCFDKYIKQELTKELFDDYKVINSKYWKLLEENKLTRNEVMTNRFIEFFDKYGFKNIDAFLFNEEYQNNLGMHAVCSNNAKEVVTKLKGKYLQCAATNGPTKTQHHKLSSTGLDKLLDVNLISEDLGYNKPSIEYFNEVFKRLNDNDKTHYIIIGDSLSSDIQGGINAGIKTVWYNPNNKENNSNIKPDYIINNLIEVLDVL